MAIYGPYMGIYGPYIGIYGPYIAGQAVGSGSRFGSGLTSRKLDLLLKGAVLGQFWPFLDLLDLKNGSSSKFYAGKSYREVWKLKINLFRDKTMNL